MLRLKIENILERRRRLAEEEAAIYAEVDTSVTLEREGDTILGSFNIRNKTATPEQSIIFKIKTIHPMDFIVRPTIGLIGPDDTGRVLIEKRQTSTVPPVSSSKFLVQVIPSPAEPEDMDENEVRESNFERLNNFFKDLIETTPPEKHVMDVLVIQDKPMLKTAQE